MEHSPLKKLHSFCSERVPVYVHPSLYIALKLKFPLDIRSLSRDGQVTTKLGTISPRHAICIFTPKDFQAVVDTEWEGRLEWLNLASLNLSGLRDPSKCIHLLGELSTSVDVTVIQETPFTCTADCQVLRNVVFSAFGNCCSAGVSQLVRYNLNMDVSLVFASDRDWLVVADVTVKSFLFQVIAVYTSNCIVEGCFFFQQVGSRIKFQELSAPDLQETTPR